MAPPYRMCPSTTSQGGSPTSTAGSSIRTPRRRFRGLYTTGWVKRGPSGVIGTNKQCAHDTVAALIDDMVADDVLTPKFGDGEDLATLVHERRPEVVDRKGWLAIDAEERSRTRARPTSSQAHRYQGDARYRTHSDKHGEIERDQVLPTNWSDMASAACRAAGPTVSGSRFRTPKMPTGLAPIDYQPAVRTLRVVGST